MPNKLIRDEIRFLMKNKFSFRVPRDKWSLFSPVIWTHPDALARPHVVDQVFVKHLKKGEMYIVTNCNCMRLN